MEQECIQSWKKWLPDYEIKCWNEGNFDVNGYDFTKKAYQFKKFAFVSDVCRLHALYQEGGIYLDTDMLVIKGFQDLLQHKFFIGKEREDLISAGIIGTEKNSKTIESLLVKYAKLKFDYNKPLDIPTFLTANLPSDQDIIIYSPDFFYPLPFAKRGRDINEFIQPETFTVHLWNHSWKQERDYLHDKNFRMALKQYFQRCSIDPKSIWGDRFPLDFIKYFLAEQMGSVYRFYSRQKGNAGE